MSPRLVRAALVGGLLLAFGARSEAAFTAVNAGSINEAGGAGYWDHTSSDGSQKNVGYYLTGTGAFGPGSAVAGLTFDAAAGAGFTLGVGGSGSPAVNLLITVAGNAGTNQLWIKDGGGNFVKIINGTSVVNVVSGVNPFTMIMMDTVNHIAYYSTGAVYTGANLDGNVVGSLSSTSKQNFAVFGNGTNNNLWFGIEDMLQGDNDYNDMVVHMAITGSATELEVISAPAPPAIALAAMGILPCLALRKRLSKKRA